MVSLLRKIISAACLLVIFCPVLSGTQHEWIGTWEGELTHPAEMEPIRLHLEIRARQGKIWLWACDSCGTDQLIRNGDLEIDDHRMCFFYPLPDGNASAPRWVYVCLDLEDNRIIGRWEDGQGKTESILMFKVD